MDKLVHGKKHHGVNTGKVTLNGQVSSWQETSWCKHWKWLL